MIHLVRSEWIKFRSVRSSVILVLVAGLMVVLIAILAANEAQDTLDRSTCERTVAADDGGTFTEQRPCSAVEGFEGWEPATANLGDVTVGIPFALFLFGALGVQIIGQEYRFNTIRPTFTAAPRRWRVLVAKLLVVTAAIAAISVVMLAICAVVGTVMLDPFSFDGTDARVVAGIVAFSIGWATMGMGVGSILRQPVAGILVLLVEAFVLEQMIAGFLPSAARWMPFLNGIQMTVREPNDSGDFLSPLAGGIYFFAVAAALWLIGAVLVSRRDA